MSAREKYAVKWITGFFLFVIGGDAISDILLLQNNHIANVIAIAISLVVTVVFVTVLLTVRHVRKQKKHDQEKIIA